MFNSAETCSGSIKAKINLVALIALGTVLSVAGFPQETFAQNTNLPMSISLEEDGFAYLTVPDRDVSRSAYGGELKLYDAHIAKMFEVTHHFCQTEPKRSSLYTWTYEKNGGRDRARNSGTKIKISCKLAKDIASEYGAGKPEITTVTIGRGGKVSPPTTFSIPILNITGGKVKSWIQFASRFKPV